MKIGIRTEFIKKHKAFLLTLVVIGIASFILVMPAFLNLVELLGHRIPQNNIQLDYVKGLIWAGLLGLSIFFWPIKANDKKALLWIWLIKCFVMLGFMLFYEYHYQIDSFGYFSGARFDIRLWGSKDLGGPNFLPVFITWLHQKSFFNSYHAVKVTFGMIGLAAIYIYYRGMVVFLHQQKIWLLYVFALFPSLLFWSSTLGKDPLVLFGVCLYCYGVIRWKRETSWYSAITMLAGIIIAAIIRPWMGFVLGIPVSILTIFGFKKNPLAAKVVVMLALVYLISFSFKQVSINFGFRTPKDLISVANQKFNGFARGGSMTRESVQSNINISPLTTKTAAITKPSSELPKARFRNKNDIIFFIPQGMFTALFRPMPGEVKNIFGFFAGIENVFMLVLFFLSIMNISRRKILQPILIWAILLILLWAGVYSFASYNLGTICRYRIQILPIFLGLLLYFISNKTKLINLDN